VTFEENRGQLPDSVLYTARSNGSTLFLTKTEAVYVLPIANGPEGNAPAKGENPVDAAKAPHTAYALRMSFGSQDTSPIVTAGRTAETRTNYFKGSDPAHWQTDVPHFGEVRYDNICDGVDMIWLGLEKGATRYDLVVKPGSDPGRIALTFEGAESLEIDTNGDLLIGTPAGVIRQARPFTYQEGDGLQRTVVTSGFRVDGRTVGFELGDYDHTKPLIIDPTVTINNLAFSTFLGSFGDDVAGDNSVDAMGNIYVTGRTTSVSFPTTSGTFDTSSNGAEDVFVTKMNPSGTGIIFSTFLGGTFFDEGRGLAVDATGNIYVAGTASNLFPTTAGAFDTTFNGGSDVFVTKLNSTGSTLLYSTYIGESAIDYANDLAIDAAGNAYIVVRTSDTVVDYPTTPGAFDTTFNGFDDVAVTKLNTAGSALVYSTFLGGSNIDNGTAIAVNTAGEAYVAGSTTDDVTDLQTTLGSYDTTHNGLTDYFVTRFSADGSSLIYSTFIGGSGIDNAAGLAIDGAGSAYVVGAAAPGFPVTAGVVDTVNLGGGEIGASKLSPDGSTLQYSTFIGGNQGENGNSVAVDPAGNAYITGGNFGGDYPVTAGAFDTTFNGANDAILTVLNPSATGYIYSTYLGGGGNDAGNDIAVDASGNVYLAGQTANNASAFPTTAEAYQTFHGGSIDAFAAKFGDYSIAGRVIDTNGVPLANVMVALSGQVTANVLTGADGRFGFTNTVPGEPHSVSATRAGYSINPSIFNIASLAANRELTFVGSVGSPTGGSGGTLAFSSLSSTKSENGGSLTVTVARTGPVNDPNPVTVDYLTEGGTAVSGTDFQPVSGVLSFAPFETIKTITVPLVNDGTLEPRESFTIRLTNPTNNADIDAGRAVLTANILDEDLGSGGLLVSEFRERGRLGANDEYVKLFNPNDFDLTINAADGSGGLAVAHTKATKLTPIVTIPDMVTIPARGHYLLTNNSQSGGFSLTNYPTGRGTTTATGDQTFASDIPDNSTLVLFRTASAASFTMGNVVDAVGFANSAWVEGTGLDAIEPVNSESCFVRRIKPGGFEDADNNRADFLLIDNRATTFGSDTATKIFSALGSPAPENTESLKMMDVNEIGVTGTDGEIYDPTPVPNGPGGTLTILRTVTNLTARPVIGLRLRAIDFPTFGSPGQRRTGTRADFRLMSAAGSGAIASTTLAAALLQPNGGGLNSTLSVDAIDQNAQLLPGQSLTVAIKFGVVRWGRHQLSLAVEALQ